MRGSGLKRRLTAILAAHLADRSRVTAVDERVTVAELDTPGALLRTQIESNHVRVSGIAGDSVPAVLEAPIGVAVGEARGQ